MSNTSFTTEFIHNTQTEAHSLKVWAKGRKICRVSENVYAIGNDITNCNDITVRDILRHRGVIGDINTGFIFL